TGGMRPSSFHRLRAVTGMSATERRTRAMPASAAEILAPAAATATPIWFARDAEWTRGAELSRAQQAWVSAQGFTGAPRSHLLLPAADGALAGVALGIGAPRGDPLERPELAVGLLAGVLPPGVYRLADAVADPRLATVAWGLGAYRFRHYKSASE